MKEFFTGKKQSKSDEMLDLCCPKMTFKQRLIGFVICSLAGWVVSLISLVMFLSNRKGITEFAILYTIGNMLCICGTCFLSGPKKQCKLMKDKHRIATSIIYILSMIGTIVFALVYEQQELCILFVIIQFMAYVWYTLSNIPFGQKIAKKICCSICNET